MKKAILFLPFILLMSFSDAQTTGSFQQSITFEESDYNATRNLYFYVPSDYDSNQSYKLVVGFRGGPHSNAGQFRDQLQFLSDSIGAIIMCPENSSHFWNDEGLTKQLFQYSVDTTMAQYNIDPAYIYLTGLSYGGRHAVIVSMDTDDGPIPNLRGVIPFATGSEGDLQPNYEDIENFPPACICIGLNDSQTFINVANNLFDDITTNGGDVLLNEIAGVGHTVAFPSYPDEMMECLNFIESHYMSTAADDILLDDFLVQVHPNPASSFIDISYKSPISPSEIYLLDETGRRLMNLPLDSQQIDVSNLSDGIKTLVFITKEGILMKRFIVLH